MRRALTAAALAALALCGCGPAAFDPQSVISGVRVLSSRTDLPYARPGERVTTDLLVVDGRIDRRAELKVGWLPVLCVNPTSDLYYACFAEGAQLLPLNADGTVANAPANGGGALDQAAGLDITDLLTPGPTLSFTMPEGVIVPHDKGRPDYGLVFLFNIACAGRVRLAARDPNGSQQQMPIQCVNEAGEALGADDYVLGFTRVYAYPERRNQNPVLQGVRFQGKPIDLNVGVSLPRCVAERASQCETVEFDVDVPAESQEEKTGESLLDGRTPREQVWASYYSTTGLFGQDAMLLYDSASGLVTDRAIDYRPPRHRTDGRIYVVVKDDRGGTAWADFPLRIE